MKYSEFKAEVEKMGYWIDIDHATIYVDKPARGETIIAIGKHKRFSVDSSWSGFHTIPEENQIAIYNLAHSLTVTPLAEREEEKRYYLRLVTPPIIKKQVPQYLRYTEYLECFTVGLARDTGDAKIKTIFTESELAEMDITGFEPEPVE